MPMNDSERLLVANLINAIQALQQATNMEVRAKGLVALDAKRQEKQAAIEAGRARLDAAMQAAQTMIDDKAGAQQ